MLCFYVQVQHYVISNGRIAYEKNKLYQTLNKTIVKKPAITFIDVDGLATYQI